MNQTLKISIARGGCRFASPLYLGSSYVLSFEGARSDEAKRVILVKPQSQNHYDTYGIVILAESVIGQDGITLSLNRSVLVEWFKSNSALDIESIVDAHCYVFNEQGDVIADSPVTIEYSPNLFIIDNEDYPTVRDILSQAASAKNQAISAKDSAISAKSAAETAKLKAEDAKTAAEKARDEAKNVIDEIQEAKIDAERASSSAKESAFNSSLAKDDAILAKKEAQIAKESAEETAATVHTALEKMVASARKVVGGVEVLLWNGQGNKPMPIFIPNGIDGITGYVKCDEDGKYYCLKCKKVDGEKVLVLEQVGVDSVAKEGYARAVNGTTPDETGNVKIPLNFLPLTGGTLTGSLMFTEDMYLFKKNNTGYLALSGGDRYEGGGVIVLRGKDSTDVTLKGAVTLYAYDGTNRSRLLLRPNGTLTLDGKDVTLDGDCLPLSGGTIKGGDIAFSNSDGIIKKIDNTGRLLLLGGKDTSSGAVLYLRGNERGESGSDNDKGSFSLYAKSAEKNIALIGYPDGRLTWGGKNVTLEGDCLPLTGGTITGNIKTTLGEFSISSDDDSKVIRISGGTGLNNGASLVVHGKTQLWYPGIFRLRAYDGTKMSDLEGKPDGTLTWDGSQTFLPAGAVLACAGGTDPSGCLICNGAAVSRTTYARLFAAISTIYGSGDGSTTFNLPNMGKQLISEITNNMTATKTAVRWFIKF